MQPQVEIDKDSAIYQDYNGIIILDQHSGVEVVIEDPDVAAVLKEALRDYLDYCGAP